MAEEPGNQAAAMEQVGEMQQENVRQPENESKLEGETKPERERKSVSERKPEAESKTEAEPKPEPEKQPENASEWMSATVATLGRANDRAKQVQQALQQLEKQEADRLAVLREQRRRQEAEAAAAEKRRKEEFEAERVRKFRERQADELKQQQDAAKAQKKEERAALKAATANFNQAREGEKMSKEKDNILKAMKSATQQVLSSVLECQHVVSKLWGVMMVCEKRQSIRKGRPPSEMFRDYVDQALEKEWQALTSGREELQVLARAGEELRHELEIVQVQLATGPSRQKAMRGLMKTGSLPLLTAGLQPEAALEGPPPQELMKMSVELLENAAKLTGAASQTLAKVNARCDHASASTVASLDQKKREMNDLIMGLQNQKAEADTTITDAEKRMVRLKRRAQHTMETPRSSKATESQLQAAEAMVIDLKGLKHGLETDLRNKIVALKMDETCRTLTRLKAGGHISKMGQTQGFMKKTVRDSTGSLPAAAG
eukprot:gb/GFBE01004452.1/.p1 GENE.gb/GFBE01004452.1/~~gb/GFBE01004452.1/.p1  ORF type:complete len:489 (+),score=143.57 gb/GFBE01004452.1/:1-1467(+)